MLAKRGRKSKTYINPKLYSDFNKASRQATSQFTSGLQVFLGGHLVAAGFGTYFGNETWYKKVLMPLGSLFLEPETAHRFIVKIASYSLLPPGRIPPLPELSSDVFGIHFKNPVGLAAGFDKHAEAVDGLMKVGFGFVEVGSVTPRPQDGNPKPRVFRLIKDKAVINRYGFNSDGHDIVAARFIKRKSNITKIEVPDDRNLLNENFWSPLKPKFFSRLSAGIDEGIVGVNLGKNKDTPAGNEADDYVLGVRTLGQFADYVVINVSSPNTAGLRNLQQGQQLKNLLTKVNKEREIVVKEIHRPLPLLVKIAPDLTAEEKAEIAAVVLKKEYGVDGLIVSNTTISRPSSLLSVEKTEVGGLSGAPLRDLSTCAIRDMYKLTKGQVPIIGVGGVSSGSDAYDKIRAGASLIQLYTALVYDGPPVVKKVCTELSSLLSRDGYKNISEAVGADNR